MSAEVTPAQWVAALESGDWTPATGQLVAYSITPDDEIDSVQGHCCLGVLARLCGFADNEMTSGAEWIDNGVSVQGPPWDRVYKWDAPHSVQGPPWWLEPSHAREFSKLNDDLGTYPVKAIKETYGLD